MISYHNGYSLDGQLNQQINKYVIVADTLEFQGKGGNLYGSYWRKGKCYSVSV